MKRKQFVLSIVLIFMTLFCLVGCTQRLELEKQEYSADTKIEKIVLDEVAMPLEIKEDAEIENPRVVYYTHERYKLDVSVIYASNTLKLERKFETTTFTPTYTFDTSCVTIIYLPENYDGELNLETTTGSIKIEGISAKTLDINVTTGKIVLDNVNVDGDVSIDSTTGSINVTSLEANKLSIDSTTGNIEVVNSNLKGRIEADLTSGQITLKNTKAESIKADLTTGSISFKKVEISTLIDANLTTGDIEISVVGKKEEFTTKLSSATGKTTGETEGGGKKITCENTVGNIKVEYLG